MGPLRGVDLTEVRPPEINTPPWHPARKSPQNPKTQERSQVVNAAPPFSKRRAKATPARESPPLVASVLVRRYRPETVKLRYECGLLGCTLVCQFMAYPFVSLAQRSCCVQIRASEGYDSMKQKKSQHVQEGSCAHTDTHLGQKQTIILLSPPCVLGSTSHTLLTFAM